MKATGMPATGGGTITFHLNGITLAEAVAAFRRQEAAEVEARKRLLLAYYNRRYPIDGSEPDPKVAYPL